MIHIFLLLQLLIFLVASAFDVASQKIPMMTIWLSGGISMIYIIYELLNGSKNLGDMAASLLPGILMLLLSTVARNGIGTGDGLMAVAIAPCFGLENMVAGIFLSFLLCSIVSGVLFVTKRIGAKGRVPFVPFMTVGMGGIYALSNFVS